MIPIAFFAGLASGFTKVRWWIVPLAAVVWVITLAVTGVTTFVGLVGGFFLAAANAAVGVAIGVLLLTVAGRIWRAFAPKEIAHKE